MGRVAAVIQQPNEFGQFMRVFAPMMSKQIDDNRRTKSLQEAYAELARQGEMIRSRQTGQGMQVAPTNSGASPYDTQLLKQQSQYDPQGSFVNSVLPAMLPLWYGGGK